MVLMKSDLELGKCGLAGLVCTLRLALTSERLIVSSHL